MLDDPALFFEKKARELKKQKKFEEALLFSDKAKKIRDDESSSDFWYKKGFHFIEVGEFEKAIECFDNDISKRRKSYETFFAKGKVLFQLSKFAEALECFNKAAEERNQKYLKTLKKAQRLKKAKKFEKALLYGDIASNEVSLTPEYWHYKGITLLKLKKYDNAFSCISNALEIENDNAKFLYDLAKCELLRGNETRCIEALKKSIKNSSTIKEKLQVDGDFSSLYTNNQFRALIHL